MLPMLDFSEIPDGFEFEVIAKPRARRNGIAGLHDGALRVEVTTAPESGRANGAIVKVLAKLLEVPPSSVTIVRGKKSRRKRLRVVGAAVEKLMELTRSADKGKKD